MEQRYNLLIVRFPAGLLLSLPLLAAPPFTIDQVLSSPFLSNMTASPGGDAVAWILNAKGVRNIWVAKAPDYLARPLTRFTSDDGQELDELAWGADSSSLFFTRGGDVNGRGDFPNPTSDPAGVQQEVWGAALTGEVRKIGSGHSPAAAPRGSTLVWVYSGQIWSATTGRDAKPAQLIHARGYAQNPCWSPDGSHFAFTSNRLDHSFIAVYDVHERKLTYPDPGVDSDQSAVWSPDSKQIAFIRVPASRYASMHGAKRTGQPWSIRMVNVRTGKGFELWHAQEGMGSVFWPMSASNQLLWGSDNRLIFPWERDGWLHLYSTEAEAGAAPKLLTSGNFEIEHATLTPNRNEVVFSSNQNDTDRRHLWRVGVSGGMPRQILSGTGIEWAPAALADSSVAFFRSDARVPARAAIMQGTQITDLAPATMPADFPSASLTVPQPVTILAADGMRLHGQLFLPSNSAVGKHPAIIFFHGGSRRQMLLGWHSMFYYHQAYGFNQYLAGKGYVVLSVNYRSGTGYGEEFREALNYGPTGASEYNDVIGAGLFMRDRADVDPERIGLWGGSYGGYLTALGLARASGMFAAGVDFHGVHDWNLEITNAIPVYEPELRLAVARTAFESSPMSSLKSWRSPVLLIHGDDDRNVSFSESVQLAEGLRAQGVHFEQLVFPDEIHDFLVHAHWVAAYQAAADFLDRFLAGPRAN